VTAVADGALAGRRIGFIGAGQIGAPMAQALAGHGADVSVYARRAEVRGELAAAGCRAVAGIAELGCDNDLVISCVFSDAQFESIADQIAAILAPGSVFASHTTGSPTTMQRFAARLADEGRDAHVVDAPFSGTPDNIRATTLTVMLGGAKEDVDRVEPVIRAYAGPVIRTGGLGSALVLKLINNIVFAVNVQVGLEVARLAEQAGLPMSSVYEVFAASSGGTKAIGLMEQFGSPQAYADHVRPFMVKDVAACERVAAQLGVDLGLLSYVTRSGRLDVSQH
jgi:3-hydroxyisobutyrate dehydrogenase-like beta-hydroxyacid dehydrogenase